MLGSVYATMLVVIGGTIVQIGTFWPMRRSVEWGRLWPFIAAGAVGVPIGVWLLVLMAHTATVILVDVVALDRLGRVFLICLLVALPALIAGGWLGWKIYGRLDERRFQQALAAMLVVSGVILVLT